LPVRTRCAKIVVQSSEPVSVVEATTPELPRDSQRAAVGTPVVDTPTVDSAIVDDVAVAIIGQGVAADTPCISLFVVDEVEVGAKHVSEAIVLPFSSVPKRGGYQWFDSAALAVGNLIVSGIRYFSKSDEMSKFNKGYNFENTWKRSCCSLL